MKLLIVIHHRFELWFPPAWFAERLRADFPDLEVHQFDNYPEAEGALADAEVLITWSLRPEQFARARKLRWIHATSAAVHGLMIPEIRASDVVITNSSSVHGPVVAEHAFAMLLALARRIPSAIRHQQQHVWAQEQLWEEHPQPRELSGATVAVIGVGAIGGDVARHALAFGMHVVAVREHPERGADFISANSCRCGTSTVVGFDSLDEVLAKADFVVLAAPLTPRTRTLISAARLRRMKPDAYLINVSRGALVDETALCQSVQERRLGGAALDVFETEPLASDSPLWDLPNVLITPHSAGFTDKMWQRHYALFSENLRRYRAHEPLQAVVDKHKGY